MTVYTGMMVLSEAVTASSCSSPPSSSACQRCAVPRPRRAAARPPPIFLAALIRVARAKMRLGAGPFVRSDCEEFACVSPTVGRRWGAGRYSWWKRSTYGGATR